MALPRKNTRVAARSLEVGRRYLQGEHQTSIARALHVSQCLISKDLEILRAEWKSRAVQDVGVLQQEELAKILAVEVEAWMCFARSKLESLRTLKERNAGREKVSIVTSTHVGDPRWLQVLLTCSARRCAITGVEAVRKFVVNWESLTDHQLELLAAGTPIQQVLTEPPPMAEA